MSRFIAAWKSLIGVASSGSLRVAGIDTLNQSNGIAIAQADGTEIQVKTWLN